MPVIESSIQRVRTNEKAQARRTAQLSAYRTQVKKFNAAAEAGADNLNDLYLAASSAIDKAVSKGLIKKNKASRDKSRLAAKLSK
jgi:small subunit ribosomal protein S20